MDATRGGVDGECGGAVTGGHFNPTFQDVDNPTVGQQGTYEIGDLGGKHGRLGIAATTDQRPALTDTTASIIYSSAAGSKGSMWIVGRSIVIHKANGARWACANIGSPGIGTTVTFPASETLPSGSIELFQPSEADSTAMIVNLDGLEGDNKWHVHVHAVPTAGDCAGTAGHFDPMNANYAGTDAPPPYEYGDLSGKHGLLTATTQAFYTDSTLPLFGETSVLGRSIVIHRNDATASRWACATIPMRIMVSFPEVAGYPHGTIMLYQDSVYDDILTELSGDLTITASLMNFPTTSVEGFKWHGASPLPAFAASALHTRAPLQPDVSLRLRARVPCLQSTPSPRTSMAATRSAARPPSRACAGAEPVELRTSR
jgi:Cu/Zn superoxide dismutase